jgi:hypothetical protein
MRRLEALVGALPETERVDVEGWGGEPTFRVRGKVFVFAGPEATTIGVKLPPEQAGAVTATDPAASPMRYGLGRHGRVTIRIGPDPDQGRWRPVEEWVRASYALVAPWRLARLVEP